MRAWHKVAQDLKSQDWPAWRSLCSERSGRILTSSILCEEEMRHLTCEISQTWGALDIGRLLSCSRKINKAKVPSTYTKQFSQFFTCI
jgi:hypothetical protein